MGAKYSRYCSQLVKIERILLMLNQSIYIAKIIAISFILSILVKFGGQWFNPSPTVATAIAAVIVPSIVLGILLAWRGQTNLGS
jgi:predicted membrane chloride channel (bestrophin family)